MARVIELVAEMQSICNKLRQDGQRIRLVPTMGALHHGHASLINSAISENICCSLDDDDDDDDVVAIKSTSNQENSSSSFVIVGQDEMNDFSDSNSETNNDGNRTLNLSTDSTPEKNTGRIVVIVSIFVNPKQFNNPADFVNYPKTFQADLELCERLGVSYVFAPTNVEIYPELKTQNKTTTMDVKRSSKTTAVSSKQIDDFNFLENSCSVLPPTKLSNDLEGKSRPGHFAGMLTIVNKLFNIIKPHEAYFGEKDYQQLVLISRMVKDLNIDVNIRPVKTIREFDLLPLSSRNVRLNQKQRDAAPMIYRLLKDAKKAIEETVCNDINKQAVYQQNQQDFLDTIIIASSLTTLTLNSQETKNEDEEEILNLIEVDYLELRCAKDLSKIRYDFEIKGYDCQEGCVKSQLKLGDTMILETRLLASIILDEIRLLDNIELKLNLST